MTMVSTASWELEIPAVTYTLQFVVGPLNSWDRAPYVTNRGAGTGPTITPEYRNISRNLLFNAGEWALDHDDGSSYMVDDSNVLVYGKRASCFDPSSSSLFEVVEQVEQSKDTMDSI